MTLNKQHLNLKQGGKERLTATVNPSYATNKTVRWSSSNQSVAQVSDNGTVEAALGQPEEPEKPVEPERPTDPENPSSASNITSYADVPLLTLNNGVQIPQLGLAHRFRDWRVTPAKAEENC